MYTFGLQSYEIFTEARRKMQFFFFLDGKIMAMI